MDGSIDAALRAARQHLPALEARLLLRHILGCEAAWLAAHGDALLDAAAADRFARWVARRAAGEPIAYLVGEREFYGRRFRVTPDVLIPRPETELLVDLALAKLEGIAAPRLLELGTGSGCIAVSLACALPRARLLAVDRSPAALRIAADNAAQYGAGVDFVCGDWLAAIDGEFDLIVANPPYIAVADPHLAQGDLRFEPRQALTPGGDGLAAIRVIAAAAPSRLAAGGWLLLEHGSEQADAVRMLLRHAGFATCECHRDVAGLDRVAAARI